MLSKDAGKGLEKDTSVNLRVTPQSTDSSLLGDAVWLKSRSPLENLPQIAPKFYCIVPFSGLLIHVYMISGKNNDTKVFK